MDAGGSVGETVMDRFADLYGGAARPLLEEQFGRAAIFIRAATDEAKETRISLTHAIITDLGSQVQEKPDGTQFLESTLEIDISTDPDAQFGGVENVGFQDAFEIDGERWEILNPTGGDHLAGFRLVRRSAIEVSRPGMRRV